MAGHRPNPRQAKSLRSYTIPEAAELYGVHRNTVRNWLDVGLAAIDGKRPILIHGDALNHFHRSRRQANRRPCGPAEMFCLGCRQPRRPAGDMADFAPITALVGSLTAICPVCDQLMSQRVNAERLTHFSSEIAVIRQSASQPIRVSPDPSPDCELRNERKGDEDQPWQ